MLAFAAVLALAAPAAADRYVAGAPGAGDPFFPQTGNGGCDVKRYSLELDYDQPVNQLVGHATIHARATQGLYRFNLDLRDFLVVSRVAVDGTARLVHPQRPGALDHPEAQAQAGRRRWSTKSPTSGSATP